MSTAANIVVPIAALPPGFGWKVLASGAFGGAIALLVWLLFRALRSDDLEQDLEWRYDVSRINELRRMDAFFRTFHPVVKLFAAMNRALFRDALPEIQRQIQAAGLPRFWLAEEYLAKLQLIALLFTPLYVYTFFDLFETPGLLLVPVAVLLMAWLFRRRLAARAAARLRKIKRRMPFLLDLLTLLMEAGATFVNALRQGVGEFEGHPVAEEFGRVLADMNMGKTRSEAFRAMRDRLSDDEITSIIGAILQGEELGTPLAKVFRSQADVLRIQRTQRAETIAGEAGVNMLLPAVMVMAAAVLIIIGPFLLNMIYFGLSM